MKKGVLWPCAFMLGAFVLLAPLQAKAEFCPARVAHVLSVDGTRDTYAVQLSAGSPRSVTGQLLLETGAGWFRAPFAPQQLLKTKNGIESAPIYVTVSTNASLMNVWLAQAASDDSAWASHGLVACAPDPERRTPAASAANPASKAQIAAMPIPAPFTYHCAKPFAQAKFQNDAMDAEPYDPGQYGVALVEIDASGKPVGITPIDASDGDFTLRKEIKDRVMHMPITPAIAYCRPVPSTYFLRESVLP